MSDTLLVIHVVAAAVWVGGAVFALYAGPRLAQQGGPVALGWMKVMQKAAPRLLIPSGVVTGLAGVGLVLVDDVFDWSDAFVGIGLAVVVVSLLIAFTVNVPSLGKAVAAAESGDLPTVASNARRILAGNRTIVLLLLVALVAMVLRVGAG